MAQPHKLFYKGDAYDFILFVESPDLLAKYRKGDTSIPLIDLVSIYKVFTNRQGGVEGVLDEASKSELSNEFGTSDTEVVIKKILIEGSDKHGSSFSRGNGERNSSIGAGNSGN